MMFFRGAVPNLFSTSDGFHGKNGRGCGRERVMVQAVMGAMGSADEALLLAHCSPPLTSRCAAATSRPRAWGPLL